MIRINLKNDKYKKSRGGYSRLLDIKCAKCSEHLFFYQKDGPGILKRIYLDRIFESNNIFSDRQTGVSPKEDVFLPEFIPDLNRSGFSSGANKYSDLESQPLKSIPQLVCSKCSTLIGVPYVYEKEKRLAFRLFVGGVIKKIIKAK